MRKDLSWTAHNLNDSCLLSNTGHLTLPAITVGPYFRLDFKLLMVGLVATNLPKFCEIAWGKRKEF